MLTVAAFITSWRFLAIVKVIAGTAKGHKLKTLKSYAMRPTSARVKESVFSIIAEYLENALVLDLFSGSGNLGIEALSRGVHQVYFVEKNEKAVCLIKENLLKTKLNEKGIVIKGDAFNELKTFSLNGKKFDIIFLDPPYNKGLLVKSLDIIGKIDILNTTGIVVAERSINEILPVNAGNLQLAEDRRYGNTSVAFYHHKYMRCVDRN